MDRHIHETGSHTGRNEGQMDGMYRTPHEPVEGAGVSAGQLNNNRSVLSQVQAESNGTRPQQRHWWVRGDAEEESTTTSQSPDHSTRVRAEVGKGSQPGLRPVWEQVSRDLISRDEIDPHRWEDLTPATDDEDVMAGQDLATEERIVGEMKERRRNTFKAKVAEKAGIERAQRCRESLNDTHWILQGDASIHSGSLRGEEVYDVPEDTVINKVVTYCDRTPVSESDRVHHEDRAEQSPDAHSWTFITETEQAELRDAAEEVVADLPANTMVCTYNGTTVGDPEPALTTDQVEDQLARLMLTDGSGVSTVDEAVEKIKEVHDNSVEEVVDHFAGEPVHITLRQLMRNFLSRVCDGASPTALTFDTVRNLENLYHVKNRGRTVEPYEHFWVTIEGEVTELYENPASGQYQAGKIKPDDRPEPFKFVTWNKSHKADGITALRVGDRVRLEQVNVEAFETESGSGMSLAIRGDTKMIIKERGDGPMYRTGQVKEEATTPHFSTEADQHAWLRQMDDDLKFSSPATEGSSDNDVSVETESKEAETDDIDSEPDAETDDSYTIVGFNA